MCVCGKNIIGNGEAKKLKGTTDGHEVRAWNAGGWWGGAEWSGG